MREYYTFSNDIVFRKVAMRYNLDIVRLMIAIARYVKLRHEVHFTIALTSIAGTMEPFVKNELKMTIQELCRLYDSGSFDIVIDGKHRIKLYVDNSLGDDNGI